MRTSRLHARFAYGCCAAQLTCYNLQYSMPFMSAKGFARQKFFICQPETRLAEASR